MRLNFQHGWDVETVLFANASFKAFTKHSNRLNTLLEEICESFCTLKHTLCVQRPFGRALYGCDAERGGSEHAVVPG